MRQIIIKSKDAFAPIVVDEVVITKGMIVKTKAGSFVGYVVLIDMIYKIIGPAGEQIAASATGLRFLIESNYTYIFYQL